MNRLKIITDTYNGIALLSHPFYREWSEGTLSVEKLSLYAAEYGRFVQQVPLGWATLGEDDLTVEEADHAVMWTKFAEALPPVSPRNLPQTLAMESVAKNLFSSAPEAIGALYAFESQQPDTTASKLDGLRKRYSLAPAAEEYFEVHAGNPYDADVLAAKLDGLTDEEFGRAVGACRLMAAALYAALDGVYYA